MAPKKRDLSDAEWHLLLQTTRKSLEKTFKSRGFAPVLPQLSVRGLKGGGGCELGGHERYWDDKVGSDDPGSGQRGRAAHARAGAGHCQRGGQEGGGRAEEASRYMLHLRHLSLCQHTARRWQLQLL